MTDTHDDIYGLPWRIISQPMDIGQSDIEPSIRSIVDKDQNNICLHWYREDMETFKSLPKAHVNAAFIVKCVNHFDEMVSLLEKIAEENETDWIEQVRALLTKLERLK